MADRIFVDRFDTTGDLTGKKRTYEAVKAAALAAGEFSIFEATATMRDARMFERLLADPEVERERGFPWIGIRRRDTDAAADDASGRDGRAGEASDHGACVRCGSHVHEDDEDGAFVTAAWSAVCSICAKKDGSSLTRIGAAGGDTGTALAAGG